MSGANTEFVDIIKLNFESNSEQLERSLAALKGYVNTLIPQMEQLAILFSAIGEKGKATTIKNFADGLIKAGNAAKFNKDNIDESIKSFHKLAQEVVYSESVFKSLRKELDTSKIKDYSKDLLKLQDNFESLKFSLKKLVETQERWTSGKHIKKANDFILNTLEKEEKEILKLQEAYRELLKDKEAAIAENDVNALNRINRELKEQNKLIQNKIDNLRKVKKEYREVATNLKEIDRVSWVKEVGKRAMAYASIYASIYGVIQVMKDAVKYISEVDLASKRLQAILGITSVKAKDLEESFRSLAKTFGGSLEEINKAALELGRAGIDPSQVREATKVVVELAMITGDSYASATNALVTFKENYEDMIKAVYKGIDPIEVLGNKIAYIANASRMSVEDISTFANYALATAKSVGLTVDMVGALAIAFNNAGNSASTVGTEIRRISTILVSKKENIKNFFDSIGLNQEILVEKFRKGGKEAEEAFKTFLTRLREIDDTDFNHLIGGLQVLDRQALTMARNTAPEVLNQFSKMKDVATDGLKEASVIAESYVNIWERFKNLLGDLALKFDEVVKIGGKALESLLYYFSDEHTQKLMTLSEKYKELIDLRKYYESIHDNKRVEALSKEIALLEKKIQLENKLKEQVESVSKAYKTIQDIHNMHYTQADWLLKTLEKSPVKGINYIFSKQAELDNYGLKKEDLKVVREELLKIIATNKQLTESLLNNPLLNGEVKNKLKELTHSFEEISKKEEEIKKQKAIFFVSDTEINNLSNYINLLKKQVSLGKDVKKDVKETLQIINTFLNKENTAIEKYIEKQKDISDAFKNALLTEVKTKDVSTVFNDLNKAKLTHTFGGKSLSSEEYATVKKLIELYKKVIDLQKRKTDLQKIDLTNTKNKTKELNTAKRLLEQINSMYLKTDRFLEIQQTYQKKSKELQEALNSGKITEKEYEEALYKLKQWKNAEEIKYVKSLKDVEDYTTRILKNEQEEAKALKEVYKYHEKILEKINSLAGIDPYKKLENQRDKYLKAIDKDTIASEKQKAELKLKVNQWYNKKLQELNKKELQKLQEEYKKYLDENYKLFLDVLNDVNQTLENDFFYLLKGKFDNFGDFLKSLFKDVGNSIYNSLAKSISGSIANYITGNIKGAVVPSFASFVGVDNFAKKLGLSLNDEGKYVGKINGKEVVVNSSGDIEKGADVIKQKFGLSDLSNLKDIYQISDKYFPEISAALSDVSAGFQTWMSGQALVTPSTTATSVNAALMGSEYGQGLATSAWSKAGYYGGGALAGAGIGYGIGTIGDMLFGTNTKAGTYGAIGGAIGSLVGPIGGIIGGAIGSMIGGMFGSKKVTSTGIYVPDSAYFGSNNLHKYEKWEKKGWTGSSSGVDIKGKVSAVVQEYFNSRFKQFDLILEELFNNPSHLTIPHGRYKEDANNPNLTRMILHQFFKTLGMSDDSVKYTRDKLVRLWEDYAKGLNKAATDAVIEAFGNVLKAKRNFEVWLAQLKGDSLKALQLQAQYAQKDLEFLKKEYGETELTVDNYLDLMNKAIENSPTPETINKWLELGDALQEATNAQEALKDAIKSEIDKGKAVYENALSLFDNKAITNTKELLEAINNAKPEDTQRILNAINTLKQKEIKSVQDNYNTRIEQLQKEKEYLQNISDIVTRLKNIANDLILSTVSDKYYLKAKFNEYLLKVRTDLQNGINPQNDVENLNTYAKSYANYLKQNAYSKQEYLFEVAKMANKINDLANKYNTKDGFKRVEEAIKQANIDLKTSIEKIDSTYKNYSNLLKLTIEQQYKEYLTTTINKYEQYLGEESPIIKKLQEIKNTLNKQIEETKQKVKGGGNFAPQGSVDKTKEAGQHTSSNVLTRAGLSFTPDVTKTSEVTASAFLTDGLVSPKDYVANLYTRFLGRKPDTEGLNAWTKQAEHVKTITDARKLQKAFISEAKKHGEEIKATYFADGGIVTKPTIGLIGEAGYSEAVIPLKNPNDPMNMNELKEEIRTLKEEIVKLREENRKYQSAIVENTAPIKNSQRYA